LISLSGNIYSLISYYRLMRSTLLFLALFSSTIFADKDLDDLSKSADYSPMSQYRQTPRTAGSKDAYVAGWLVKVDKETGVAEVVVEAANIRAGIGTSHKVVRVGKKGEKFPFLSFNSNSRWVRISLVPVAKRMAVESEVEKQKGNTVKVRSGNTLSVVARENYAEFAGSSRAFRFWPLIYVASGLSSTNLTIGQDLVIPGLSGDKQNQVGVLIDVMVKSVHNLQALLDEDDRILANPLVKFLKGEYSKMVAALYPEFQEEFAARLEEVLNSNREEFYRKQLLSLTKHVQEATALEDLADLSTRVQDTRAAIPQGEEDQQIITLENLISERFVEVSRESMQELREQVDLFKKGETTQDLKESSKRRVRQQLAYRLFERRYDLFSFQKIPTLEKTVTKQIQEIQELEKELGPPEGTLHPSIKRMNKGSNSAQSITVLNSRFNHWLEVASLLHEKDCQAFPKVVNRYGDTIHIGDVIRAVIIQESAGVHRKGNGEITAGLNKKNGKVISRDLGFGQINTWAHRKMKINVLSTANRIEDGRYPYGTLVSRFFYNTGTAAGKKSIQANFENPMHNLHGMSKVLSSTINRSVGFENTSGDTERLVKALSAYNHGMNSSDYRIPWQTFVAKVAEGRGNYGEEVAVHYGIRLQLLLGMDPSHEEINYLKKERNSGTMSSFYHDQVEYTYAYANFPEDV
jgi:uncharacterized protein YgiM (DUF1202 family)